MGHNSDNTPSCERAEATVKADQILLLFPESGCKFKPTAPKHNSVTNFYAFLMNFMIFTYF